MTTTQRAKTRKMKDIIGDFEAYRFEGHISLEKSQGGYKPWRIPYDKQEFFPFISQDVGQECSGIRISMRTDSSTCILGRKEDQEGRIDLLINEKFVRSHLFKKETHQLTIELPGQGMRQVEIWLDQALAWTIKQLEIDDSSQAFGSLVPKEDQEIFPKKLSWVHYGSSISQAKHITSPSRIWLAQTARQMGLSLTNLGLSGQCVMDPMMGRVIGDVPADLISLKLGINTYPGLSTIRMFESTVIGLISSIRDKHPMTPLLILSPIYSENREAVEGPTGLTLSYMRGILEGVVRKFYLRGDDHIYYRDGRQILDQTCLDHLPDGLHPDGIIQDHMAHGMTQILNEILVLEGVER